MLDGWEALHAHGQRHDPRHGLAPGARRWEQHRLLDVVFGAFHPWPPAWVAVDDSVVGFLTSQIAAPGPTTAPPTARIDDLWVAPSHRRRGIGTQLVEAWQQAARSGGAEAFEVSTLSADACALAFWQAVGFGPWRTTLRSPT